MRAPLPQRPSSAPPLPLREPCPKAALLNSLCPRRRAALLGADMTAVRIEIIVLEVEHFTSPTANFTTKGADFAAWFAQHDYVPAVVFPVDRMPPPPLTAKSVLTEIPRWGSLK